MQVGTLFAYPSAQYTGRFSAVVRTLLPVMIAELLFCVTNWAAPTPSGGPIAAKSPGLRV